MHSVFHDLYEWYMGTSRGLSLRLMPMESKATGGGEYHLDDTVPKKSYCACAPEFLFVFFKIFFSMDQRNVY